MGYVLMDSCRVQQPEVDFDIGESYAGTLSIDDNEDNENQLWFWVSQWPAYPR